MINRDKIKNDNGVTLIALVITIAVLLILAGVTIAEVFSDEGLWDKSNQFAESANATIEENSEQVNNMINELDEIMNPWVQNKTVVTKKMKSGTKTYNVGDDYTYDCGVSGYTGKWKVLGAEKGKLLILSTIDVGTLTLSGKDGYNTGISKLNAMCATYGKNSRSITVEDINRVTGYDPTNTGTGTKYEVGNTYEYGNTVTYKLSGATSANGATNTSTGATAGTITTFICPDGRTLGQNGVDSIAIKSTHYWYYPDSLTNTEGTGTVKGISKTSAAYKMIFGDSTATAAKTGNKYWLASHGNGTYLDVCSFNTFCVREGGYVRAYNTWNSNEKSYQVAFGVRAVVPVE